MQVYFLAICRNYLEAKDVNIRSTRPLFW